jgi:hypothetical protein
MTGYEWLEPAKHNQPSFAQKQLRRVISQAEIPFSKGVARSTLQVILKILCEFQRFKRGVEFYLPGPNFGCMRTIAGIVIG